MPDPGLPLRSFAVVPPGSATRVAFVILAMLLLVPLAGFAVAVVGTGDQAARALLPFAGLVAGGFAVIVSLLHLALRRRSVTLEHDLLVVRAGLNTHRIAVSALDLEHARVVDLAERTELRPVIKTNGMYLPGLQTGWFRMRDRWRKGFYLITDRRRVLWLPERDGLQLLLSLEKPQALLSALKDVAHHHDAR